MPKFNPDVQTSNDPSYLGYSRETGGDKSMASLFSGLGDLFGAAVKGVDEENQQTIKGELDTGVAKVNQDVMGALGTTEAEENQDEEYSKPRADAIEGGERNDVLLSTPDGASAINDAKRLTLAVREGKITGEHYWSRMEVLSKKLKARYPGYSDVIDRQFQGATGAIPANAYAAAQRSAYNATLTQATAEEKEWRTYVRQNQEYLPPDYYSRIEKGQPYTQLEIQERVRQLKARDYQQKYEENEFAKGVRQGNENKEKAIGLASNKVNVYVDQLLSDGSSGMKDLAPVLKKAQENPKDLTPDDQMKLRNAFAEFRLKAEQGVHKLMTEPWDDKNTTYLSAINDPAKIKAIKEGALERIDNFQKLIEDKDFGLLNASTNWTKAVQDTAQRKILESHNWFPKMNALKDLGGAEIANSMFLDPQWNKETNEAAKAFRDVTVLNTLLGDSTPMKTQLEKAKETADQLGVNSASQKALFKKNIDDQLTVIQAENAPIESYQGAATALFGPKNKDFLKIFPNSQQKHDMYMKLTAPQVTERMKELGKVDPSLYNQYKEWAKGSFAQQTQSFANGVQEGVVFREGIDISYDPESNHFVVNTTEKGANRLVERNKGSTGLVTEALKGVEDNLSAASEDAVRKLNREIDNLKPILMDEKKDVNEELSQLFKGMGLNTEAPKAKTFMQKARGAILKALGTETKGSEETPADKEAQKGAALRTFTQYARAGGMDATNFLTRIRADGNENVEGLDKEFSSRLATMLQDAPEEVRKAVQVDSGYRSVEHQRKLWNAALAKYGSVRAARRWVAPPGHSYHGKGLAVDLKYASPESREWIRDNAKKYGLHFPLSNENWHIEMQGSRKPRTKRKTQST